MRQATNRVKLNKSQLTYIDDKKVRNWLKRAEVQNKIKGISSNAAGYDPIKAAALNIKEQIWINYYKYLKKKINYKKEEEKEKKLKETLEENKIIQQQNEKYKEMYRTQYIAKRKLQKDFQEVNEKLVEDKKKKQKDDKLKQIKLEEEFIQNEQQRNRNLDNKTKKRKEELNNICRENLKISLENRKRKQEFKNEENNKIYKGFHIHENKLGRCGKCNKAVPPNVLAKSPFHNRVILNHNKNLKY